MGILRCSSASQKSLKQNHGKKISSLFVSVLTEPRSLRFSDARDVLPFCGLIHLSSSSRTSKPKQ
jgi:hypothetical protein